MPDELRAKVLIRIRGRGERGELCIGGPGVALGYLGQPDLTAQRFVVLPTVPAAGLVYRTGDRVRRLPGGLDLIGRLDRQVKVRGFRIELEEIERCLVAGGTAELAVVEKVGDGAAAHLVAFILPSAGACTHPADLTAALDHCVAQRLPTYMRPNRWIVLDFYGRRDRQDRPDRPARPARPEPPD